MTVNTQINGASVGVTNVGNGVLPQKLTLQSTTTAFVLASKLTNPAEGSFSPAKKIRVWYASHPEDMTAAVAAASIQHARYFDTVPSPKGNGVVRPVGEIETVAGEYLYLWCDIPAFDDDATFTLYVTELP